MKRTPLRPKKIYYLKRSPIKPKIRNLNYENLEDCIIKHNWKDVRYIGLKVFSEYIKERAHCKCEICHKPGSDAHHWCFTRANNSLTDIMPENGIYLCRICHIKAHNNYNKFKDLVLQLNKYDYNKLLLEHNKSVDFDKAYNIIKDMYKELEELKKAKLKSNKNE